MLPWPWRLGAISLKTDEGDAVLYAWKISKLTWN